VDELVSAVPQHLPLKEDFEEYELVFKAFLTLFSAGHKLTLGSLPKMLKCATIFKVSLSVNVLTHGSPALGVSVSPRASPRPGCQSSELCYLPPVHRAVELKASHITQNC
jgi:hypothetical protein